MTLTEIATAARAQRIRCDHQPSKVEHMPDGLTLVTDTLDAIAVGLAPRDWTIRVRETTGFGLEYLARLQRDGDCLHEFLRDIGASATVEMPRLEGLAQEAAE